MRGRKPLLSRYLSSRHHLPADSEIIAAGRDQARAKLMDVSYLKIPAASLGAAKLQRHSTINVLSPGRKRGLGALDRNTRAACPQDPCQALECLEGNRALGAF